MLNKYENISKEELHNIINKSRDELLNITSKINVLEEELNTLKLKERKINTKIKKILRKIIIILIYNLVYLTALMSYIHPFINGFKVAVILDKSLYAIELYIGIIIISVTMAILSVKIENKIKERRIAILEYLRKKIEEKTNEIMQNKQKELELVQEIDEISNDVKEEPEIQKNMLKEDKEEININTNKETQIIPKTRKKIKNKNNIRKR